MARTCFDVFILQINPKARLAVTTVTFAFEVLLLINRIPLFVL